MARHRSSQLYGYDGNLALSTRQRQKSSIDYYQNKQYRHHSSYNQAYSTNKGKIASYSSAVSKRIEGINRDIDFLKKKQSKLQEEIDKLENGENNENEYVQEQIDELNAELQRISKQLAEDAKTVISLGISAGTGGGEPSASSSSESTNSASSVNESVGSSHASNNNAGRNASDSNTGVSSNAKRRKQIDSFLEKKEKLDKITSITGNPVGIVSSGFSKSARKISKFGKEAEQFASGNANYDPQKQAQKLVQDTFKKLNDTRRKTNSAIITVATLIGGPLGGLIAVAVILLLTLVVGAALFFGIFTSVGSSLQNLSSIGNDSSYTYDSGDTDFNFSNIASTDKNTLAASYAVSKVGCEYNQAFHGSTSVDIFDCSSLAYRAYKLVGIDISNNGNYTTDGELRAAEQRGQIISIDDIQPGDLIFYWKSDSSYYKGVGHVEIYVGNGKVVSAEGRKWGVILKDFEKTTKSTATRHVLAVSRPF